MKAAVLTQLNSEIEILDIEPVGDLKYGQVYVKISYSGLCGAQLQEIAGLKNNSKFLPHLIGHEGCGTVVSIGPGVTKVSPGDKVILHWRKAAGHEATFPLYVESNSSRNIAAGKVTTLSEYSIVSENRITKVPADSNEIICTLLGCSMSTAFGVVNNDANIKIGEDVLIIGCGGVGMQVLKACSLVGANKIYVIDNKPDKAETIVLNGGIPVTDAALSVDCIIDTTGKTSIVSKYMAMLKDGGRVVFVSQPSENLEFINPGQLFSDNGKRIIFSQGGQTDPDRDFIRYLQLAAKIDYNIDTSIFSLDDINTAINQLKTGNHTRIIIKL